MSTNVEFSPDDSDERKSRLVGAVVHLDKMIEDIESGSANIQDSHLRIRAVFDNAAEFYYRPDVCPKFEKLRKITNPFYYDLNKLEGNEKSPKEEK